MKKAEFIKAVAEKVGKSQKEVAAVVEAVEEVIFEVLKNGQEVKFAGVKFVVETAPARKARNPRTGETIEIPARKVVKVKKLSALKKLFG
jgi:DNA-binding protein HU-beta